MVLYWFFYSLLNQMSSDSPGDPYQKEHKLVDKCIEKKQVHPDVVQPEIIAGSYRPLIFLFIGGSFYFIKSIISPIPIATRKKVINPRKYEIGALR
jgi:hypothetical protein